MTLRPHVAATLAGALLTTSALAGPDYNPAVKNRYPSPNLYAPDTDTLTIRGDGIRCGPGAACDASPLNITTGLLGAINRTLANRAADRRNVRDFGASLSGTSSDQGAFNAARAATPALGTIEVPPGRIALSSDPTGGPAGPVLWRLTGNTSGTSNVPVITMGSDWVETFLGLGGGHYIGRRNSSPDGPPVQRLEQTIGYTGGTSGYVVPTLQTTTYVPDNGGNLTNYIWNSLSRIYSYANGAGEHNASYMQTNRMAGNAKLWGATIEYRDYTGLASSLTGSGVGLELDLFGNGLDDASNRVGIDVTVGRHNPSGPAMEAAYGVRVTGQNGDVTNTGFKTGFSVVSKITNAAIDTSQAVMGPNAVAIRVGDGRKMDFSIDATRYLLASGGQLSYFVKGYGTPRFQSSDDGTFSTFGVLRAFAGVDASQSPTGTVAVRVGDGRRLDYSNDGSRYMSASGGQLSYYAAGNATPRFQVADDGTFNIFGILKPLSGVDASGSPTGTVVVRLGDGRKLDFSNDGSRYMNASGGQLSYFAAGNATPRFQVADDGTLNAFGIIQALGGLKFPNFTGSGNRFLCINASNVAYASSTACS